MRSSQHKNSYQMALEKYGPDYFKKRQEATRISTGEKRFGIPGLRIPENTVTILSDPDPVGGFRRGSEINGLAEALAVGSFSEHTIVEYKEVKYEVVGLVKQRLVRLR